MNRAKVRANLPDGSSPCRSIQNDPEQQVLKELQKSALLVSSQYCKSRSKKGKRIPPANCTQSVFVADEEQENAAEDQSVVREP